MAQALEVNFKNHEKIAGAHLWEEGTEDKEDSKRFQMGPIGSELIQMCPKESEWVVMGLNRSH